MTTKTCLILAAGNGRRMLPLSRRIPKPLVSVHGSPLLEHVILAAREAGIERFVVVVGDRGWMLRDYFARRTGLLDSVQWVENDAYERGNGISALKARDLLREPFLLLMADHLFEPGTALALLRQTVRVGEVILAVDRKLDQIFDLEDATKVVLQGGFVAQIGKTIPRFDGVDTGMFLCHPALFEALEASVNSGDDSLTAGMRYLASQDCLRAWDVGGALWLDVDTPQALLRGEEMLRRIWQADASSVFAFDSLVSQRLLRHR